MRHGILRSLPLLVALLPPGAHLAVARSPQDPAKVLPSAPSFTTTARELGWEARATPVKIVGPIHFVGTRGLSSWLITTPEGHILINTGLASSAPMIAASIRQLGFRPEDVRLLLLSHAHVDHVGALAALKRLSGARVAVMAEEAELLRSGGKTDFRYGDVPEFRFEAVQPDRLLHDGDTVSLGGITLTARHTPGHTRGDTTWTTEVSEAGQIYRVVFLDGTGVNPGYRLAVRPSYPGIEADYRRTFAVLRGLTPDIWLTPHPEAGDFEAKRARAATEGAGAWVDPKGYRERVSSQEQAFRTRLSSEQPAAPPPP